MQPGPIRILPAGGPEVASARLRALALARALAAAGADVAVGAGREAGFLLVQKRLGRETLAQAMEAAGRGVPVLWDADDTGPALDFWARPRRRERLLPFLAGVTTDTTGHAEQLAPLAGSRPLEVVPDMVDYDPPGPQPLADLPVRPLRILWFGSFSNIGLLERWLPAIARLPDIELVACTSAPPETGLWRRWPMLRHRPWSVDAFVGVLRSCHLSLLMHDGGPDDRGKSNNRQITSMCWGVPAIVSRTPAYADTAAACGAGETVCDGPEALAGIIEGLRSPAKRQHLLHLAQPEIWKRWSPATVARTALAAYARIAASPPPRRPGPLARLSAHLP